MIPLALRSRLSRAREQLLLRSLRAAAVEQNLWEGAQRLRSVAHDLEGQYSTMRMDSEFLRTKVACQHAFQTELAASVLPDKGTVVDIGDSSGNHIRYLKALRPACAADFLSVNLDEEAVARIQASGLKAVRARAEELSERGIDADVFLLFETLEHLSDPFNFLHGLASRSRCRHLVVTVPWVRRSRLGLHHIRQGIRKPFTAERVHLLELCPEDLGLLFRHAGWKLERERVYRQYPLRSPLRLTRPVWASWDFEGFYGAVLTRDDSWSSLYRSWP